MDVLQLWDRSSDNLQRRENIVQRVIRAFEGSSCDDDIAATATSADCGKDSARTGKAHLVYESITLQSYRRVLEDYGILFAERIVQHLSVLKASKLYPLVYYHGLAVIVCSRYGPMVGDELIKLNLVLLLKWTLSLNLVRYHRHILYALQMIIMFCKLKLAYKDIILDNGFLELILHICYRSHNRLLHEKICSLLVELLSSDSYADTGLFQCLRSSSSDGAEVGFESSESFLRFSSRSVFKLLHNKHIMVKRAAVLLLLKVFETNNTIGKKCLANIDAMELRMGDASVSAPPAALGDLSWRESLLPDLTRLLLFGDRTARFESAELLALLYLDGLEGGGEGVCRGVFSSISNLLFLGHWYPEAAALLDGDALRIEGVPHENLNLEDAFEALTRDRLEPAIFVLYVCNRVLKHVLAAAGGAAARSYALGNARLLPASTAPGELTSEPALCEAGSQQEGSASMTLHGSISLESPNLVQHPTGSPFRLSTPSRPAAQHSSAAPSPRLLFQSPVVTVSLQYSRGLVSSSLAPMRQARVHHALLLYILKNASLDSELEHLQLDLRQRSMGGLELLRALFNNVSALRWRRDEEGHDELADCFDMGDGCDDDDERVGAFSYDDTFLSFMPPKALVSLRSLESDEDVLSRLLKVYKLNLLLGAVATLQRWLEEDDECDSDLRSALTQAGLTTLDSPGTGHLDLWGTMLAVFCGAGATEGDEAEQSACMDTQAEPAPVIDPIRRAVYQLQKDLEIKGRLAELERGLVRLAANDGSAADGSGGGEEEDGGRGSDAPSTGSASSRCGHETYKIIMNALLQKRGAASSGDNDKDRNNPNPYLDDDELEEVLVKMKHNPLHKETYNRFGNRSSMRASVVRNRGSKMGSRLRVAGGARVSERAASASPRNGRMSSSPTQLCRTGLVGTSSPSPTRREGSPERELGETRGERLVRQIAKDARCNRGVRFADIYMDTLRDLRTASQLEPVSFAIEEESDDEPSRADSSSAALDTPKNNAAVTFENSVRTVLGDQTSVSTLTVTVVSPRSPRVARSQTRRWQAEGQRAQLRQQKALLEPNSPMQRAMWDLASAQILAREPDDDSDF